MVTSMNKPFKNKVAANQSSGGYCHGTTVPPPLCLVAPSSFISFSHSCWTSLSGLDMQIELNVMVYKEKIWIKHKTQS